LRSGRIISPEESNIHQEQENENNIQPTITPSTVVIMEETEQGGNTVEQQNPDEDVTPPPPFPERLMIEKPVVYPNFDIVGELRIYMLRSHSCRLCKTSQFMQRQLRNYVGRSLSGKLKIHHQLFTW
jgi:hypothetical protein